MPRRPDSLHRHPTRFVLALMLVVLAVFAMACSGSKHAPASPTPTATVAAPPTPRVDASGKPLPPLPADVRPFPPDLKAEGDKILDEVSKLRNMPVKGPVQMNLIGRKAAIDYYRAGYDLESRQRTELEQKVYQLLGLIPAGTDINETFLKLLGTGILGFYDPDTKAFYLLDDLGGLDSPVAHTTVVHELTHALQDQYFDINAIEQARLDANDWDGVTAFLDTVEGDAVTTEGTYKGASSRRAPCFQIPIVINLPNVPFVIYRGLNTWYEDGYCFVDSVAPDISLRLPVLGNMPTTTEQVLHPDKYAAGEGAKPVVLTPLESALGEGWAESGRANIGEFLWQDLLVLGERNNRPAAQKGAEGWGGDGWVLYAKGDSSLIEVATAWDSATEAREFYNTLLESLSNRSPAAPPITGDTSFSLQLDTSLWRVAIANDRVTLVVSTDADALSNAAAQLGM